MDIGENTFLKLRQQKEMKENKLPTKEQFLKNYLQSPFHLLLPSYNL